MQASCLLDHPDDVAAHAGAVHGAISGVFTIRAPQEPWEWRGNANLRRRVFCEEQQLFNGSDEDSWDGLSQSIIAISYAAGMGDEVVGSVRIYETEPGVWYGSRLAVSRDWRGMPTLASGLIRSAVCTAHARGCRAFRANVQRQNVPLFRRLRWRTLGEIAHCGRPHHLMEADLDNYPATDNSAIVMAAPPVSPVFLS